MPALSKKENSRHGHIQLPHFPLLFLPFIIISRSPSKAPAFLLFPLSFFGIDKALQLHKKKAGVGGLAAFRGCPRHKCSRRQQSAPCDHGAFVGVDREAFTTFRHRPAPHLSLPFASAPLWLPRVDPAPRACLNSVMGGHAMASWRCEPSCDRRARWHDPDAAVLAPPEPVRSDDREDGQCASSGGRRRELQHGRRASRRGRRRACRI